MDVVAADVNGGNAEVARDHDLPDPGVDVGKSPKSDDVNIKDSKSKDEEDVKDVKENEDKESDLTDGKKDVKDKVGDKLVSDEMISKKESDNTVHDTNKMEDQEKEVNGDIKVVSVSKKSIVTPVGKRKLRKVKANSINVVESELQDSPAANVNSSNRTRNQKRKLSEPDNHSSDSAEDFLGYNSSESITNPALEVLQKLIAEAEAEISTPQPPLKRQKLSLSKGPLRKNVEVKTEDHQTDVVKGKKKVEKIEPSEDVAVVAPVKNDASGKSPPSAKTPVARRGMRNSHASPALAVVPKKASCDVTQPEYKEPFKYGWRRELVYKSDSDPTKKTIEVSYYTPKGKRVRSLREVAEFLNTTELTIDNFIFTKEPTGINDPQYEIIKDEATSVSTTVSSGPVKKVGTGKRILTPKRLTGKTSPLPVAKTVAKALPLKTSTPGIKVKVPVKRGAQKKDISPPKETDLLTWTNSSNITRRSQGGTEKASPYKSKRSLKTKLQEPCSIRCAMSMGLIPSLQCCVCLCLYHPECVGHAENSVNEDYVCKNCQQDNEESRKVSITPPPLIPISMIGTETAKSLFPAIDRQSPPKALSKNLKPDDYSKNSRDSLSTNKLNTAAWYSRRDFMQRQDGSEPKPAQNIAIVNGKKFIVVPKNNAGSVQPAIRPKAPTKLSMIDDNDKINYSRELENREPWVPKETVVNSREESKNISTEKSKEAAAIDVDQRRNSGDKTDDIVNHQESVQAQIPVAQEVKNVEEPIQNKNQENLQDKSKENVNEIENSDEKVEKMSNEKILEMIEEKVLKSSVEMAEHMDVDEPNTSDEMPRESEFDGSREIVEAMEVSEQTSKENLNEKKTDESVDKENIDKTQSETDKKKAIVPMAEVDQRQYFMATVCSGYNALARVFQYLKVQELLRAARVCKMWRDIAVHPSLWKTVRMKNSQVTDWDGLVATLQRHGTQHLDLRKMLVAAESDSIWEKFVSVIPNVKTLVKLELCRCPVMVVEQVIKACPQLQVLSAMSIKCDWLNLDNIGNLKSCEELRLKAITGMSLYGDLTPLQNLSQLSHLSLTSVKELGKKKIEILGSLVNLESLELGECSDFPSKFGTAVLCKLTKLERLRLEKGQGSCCTFDILKGVAKLEKLHQLELVNFDVKNGFDKHLANCKNIKRLLIIPTYISQSATSNNMVLGGVTELSNSLTYFVWGVTLELLRVTQLFVDQCNQMDKQVSGDSIPVLKPVPCLSLIEDAEETQSLTKGEEKSSNSTNPQVDILPLPQLKKLLAAALPKTRVKILMIPFHATWRQSISDSTSQ